MKQLKVKLDSYTSTLRLLPISDLAILPDNVTANEILWVTDDQVWAALTGPGAPQSFRLALANLMHPEDRPQSLLEISNIVPRPSENVIIFTAGEANKTWEQVASVITRGFSLGLARDAYIIGLGGGVVCDMAAFAASLYMRGCRLILIPSTLLAQVDAAFGGKTGINFGGFKNMVGTFYPATEVRIIPELNQTLPAQEYLSGLGEVIKHAFLVDAELLTLLSNQRDAVLSRSSKVLAELVWKSLLVKAQIVEQDFKEQSIRAHLNLGHTFAHGLESAAGFGKWTHGEAVAWGMVKAARLSQRLGLCSKSYADQVCSLISDYGYRTKAEGIPVDSLIQAMLMDKKKKAGSVRFILQKSQGETVMQPVAEADLRAVLLEG